MPDYDCIIIGSGAGGLSAAICLSRAGKKVAVIEQHYVPGGWCHSFYIDGHRFSPGVHYIGLVDEGDSTNDLYKGLGIANDLVFFRMNKNGYEHFQNGEERISMPADVNELFKTLSVRFPKEKKGLKKYLDLIQKVSSELYLIPKMNGFWDNVTIPYRTRHLGKYALFSLKRVIGWHIKDPLLQNVLNIQCGDHGMPPAKASFPLHCALMAHYFKGGFYPMGGGAAIVKAMTTAIKKNGGEIKTGIGVKQIITMQKEGGKKYFATGVMLDNGQIITAKQIISNTDPAATYNMVEQKHLSNKLIARLSKTKYSLTSLMFFIIVDMDLRKAGIDSGNIWTMPNCNLDDVYNNLTKQDILATDNFESLFISCPTIKDPSSYNGKHHTLEVVTFIDYDSFKAKLPEGEGFLPAYKILKEKLSTKVLNSLEKVIPGISKNIVQLSVGTPVTNCHYIKSTKGNVYGTEKGFYQTGPFSFNAKTEIENLYMCGASIISHGVAGASYSGVKTAAIILNTSEDELIHSDASQKLRVYDAEDESNWPDWLLQKRAEKKRKIKSAKVLKPI